MKSADRCREEVEHVDRPGVGIPPPISRSGSAVPPVAASAAARLGGNSFQTPDGLKPDAADIATVDTISSIVCDRHLTVAALAGAATASAEVTPAQLAAAGWTCFQDPVLPRISCSDPGHGRPVLGAPADRPPSYEFKAFTLDGRSSARST